MGLPDLSLAEAKAKGVKTLVIGVANRGGIIKPSVEEGSGRSWKGLRSGVGAAQICCVKSPKKRTSWPKATGLQATWRTGTRERELSDRQWREALGQADAGRERDLSVGKMYTALCMEKELPPAATRRRSAPPANRHPSDHRQWRAARSGVPTSTSRCGQNG